MAHLKYHWAVSVPDPSKCRNAWKAHTGGYYARACGRRYANASFPDSADDFVNRAKRDPDWHCLDCAKAARLALAAESAPKPDTVVWPKPRPISEAPTDEAFLGFVSADKLQTVHPGWYRMTAASDVVTDAVTGWVILGALPSRDQHFTITRLTVTHFLPLPPEVR